MPPQEFYVRFQHGIAGGFLPASPKEIHELTRSLDNPSSLVVRSALPEIPGSLVSFLAMNEVEPKSLSASDEGSNQLVDELHAILKELPTEDPVGSEDIYGMDTSISWGSDDLQWSNSAPEGCLHGISKVHVTEEQRAKFKRAVEIVKQLVGKAS